MDVPAILAIIGGIALLVGLFGGGVKAKEIVVPKIPRWPRILSGIIGLALIVAAVALSYINSRPLVETTAQPVAAVSPDKLTVVQQGTQQPNPPQPATEIGSGSPGSLMSDSFDDSTSERGYNTSLWNCNNCEVGSVSRENGAIRLEVNGADLALNLSSRPSWPSSQVGYIGGRLKLMKDEKNGNGVVDLSLHTTLASKYWQTGCLISPSQFSLTQAEYSCEIFTVDAQKQWRYEYHTPTTVADYGDWHTAKIELMPNTLELRFYLDDKLIGQHTPMDLGELKSKEMTAQIGIYTYSGKYGHIVAYADDVLVAPAP